MPSLVTHTAVAPRHAELRRADARLVTLAAECAERLNRICADWPRTRRFDLAYEVALGKLKAEMAPAEHAALRARYAENRDAFDARLVAAAAS
jgi:hypothetical protein